MDLLRPIDLYCLRQTALVFYRIFYDNKFSRYHERLDYASLALGYMQESPEKTYVGFRFPENTGSKRYFQRMVLPRLKYDSLCKFCFTAWGGFRHPFIGVHLLAGNTFIGNTDDCWRRREYYRRLWCHGCLDYHTVTKFSPKMRRSGIANYLNRSCILHEGRTRICPHMDVDWRKVFSSPENETEMCCTSCAAMPGRLTEARFGRDGLEFNIICSIPVLDVDDASDGSISWDVLEGKLNDLSADATREGDLCPHVKYNDGKLLQSFHKSKPVHLSDIQTEDICVECLTSKIFYPGSSTCTGVNVVNDHEPVSIARCDVHSNTYCCSGCHTTYKWIRLEGRLSIMRMSTSYLKGPAPWIGTLTDPYSYGLHTDDWLEHVSWCKDSRCGNWIGGTAHSRFLNRKGPPDFWTDYHGMGFLEAIVISLYEKWWMNKGMNSFAFQENLTNGLRLIRIFYGFLVVSLFLWSRI